MILFNKKIIKTIFIVVCSILGAFLILRCFIKREAPLFDGRWANEDGSFILDTETFTATITTDDRSETLVVAYTPGTDFVMHYPLPEGATSIYAGDFIHTGEIYWIKFFGIDYIRVKCEDGCFDVWLKKAQENYNAAGYDGYDNSGSVGGSRDRVQAEKEISPPNS